MQLESVRKYLSDYIICFSYTNKFYGDLEYIKYKEKITRYEVLDYYDRFNELVIKNIEKTKDQTFNIDEGYNSNYFLFELFYELEKELNVKLSYKKLLRREIYQKFFIDDIGKTEKCFAWKPKMKNKKK